MSVWQVSPAEFFRPSFQIHMPRIQLIMLSVLALEASGLTIVMVRVLKSIGLPVPVECSLKKQLNDLAKTEH